jgi:adenylate cyclase
MRRTLTVILASDVAGYSRLVAEHEEETIRRFGQAATVFKDLVKKHQGSVFNTAGDAILAKFDSAVDATRCAIDIQDANNAENGQLADQDKLLFRIGIAIGDVLVAENGDLLGDAVNIAARLENLAEPGGICISEDVRSHVLNKIRLNVLDLGDQNLRNIPRAIRAFKIVAHSQMVAASRQGLARRLSGAGPIAWLVSGVAVAGILGLAALGWHLHSSPTDTTTAAAEQPFDPWTIPLITDRLRESLASYEREPDFKAIAISREGWGVAIGAVNVDIAKREALDRCEKRDQKGYCRIYAIGNKVFWSKGTFPLPSDMRADPVGPAFVQDDIKLISWALKADGFERYLKGPNHKALAIRNGGFWFTASRPDAAEAARLATERCSDLSQAPCLLISVDGFPTHRFPTSYHVTGTLTLAGEKEMTEADRERIEKIYVGKDWRALARGLSQRWYAVSDRETEAAAVDQVLKACREADKLCTLWAIGNLRVGKSKE